MSVKNHDSRRWNYVLSSLFPSVREEFEPMTGLLGWLITILDVISLEGFVPDTPRDRRGLARTFVSVLDIPNTSVLIDRLGAEKSLHAPQRSLTRRPRPNPVHRPVRGESVGPCGANSPSASSTSRASRPNGAPAERRAPAGWGKPIETAIQSCAAATLSRTKPSGHDFWTMTGTP
jgi:hypothetical protein